MLYKCDDALYTNRIESCEADMGGNKINNEAHDIVKKRTGFDIKKSERTRLLLQASAITLGAIASIVFFSPIILPAMVGVSVSITYAVCSTIASVILGMFAGRQAVESMNEKWKQQQSVSEAVVVQNEKMLEGQNVKVPSKNIMPESSFADKEMERKPKNTIQTILNTEQKNEPRSII